MLPVSAQEARSKGLRYYFTGESCKHGHISKRYASTWGCAECVRQLKVDSETNRKKARGWLARNRERARLDVRKWKAANPEKLRAQWANRRARELAALGTHTAADVEALFISQCGECRACGESLSTGYEVDHVVALSKGGSNWLENLQLLCPACNRSKAARDFGSWLSDFHNTRRLTYG